MKLKVYENHNRVIALGHQFGKRIKVMAVCHADDTFDADFGKKLAEFKYKIAKKDAKIAEHKRYIKALKAAIAECEHEIAAQEAAIVLVTENRDKVVADKDAFIATKYVHNEG